MVFNKGEVGTYEGTWMINTIQMLLSYRKSKITFIEHSICVYHQIPKIVVSTSSGLFLHSAIMILVEIYLRKLITRLSKRLLNFLQKTMIHHILINLNCLAFFTNL